jgi:CheY-like chemotaxis protein
MPSILCVDDEPNQLILYRFAFGRVGFQVFSANNGQEAIEMAQTFKPDLILMDMMMPIMDGYQATVEIKTNAALAHIPIVLFTAYHHHALTEKAQKAGAAIVLPKTTPPSELLEKIQALLPKQPLPQAQPDQTTRF